MPTTSQSLPNRFPVFPLEGALLLPRGNLPLNIFEQRYLSMVQDAMQTDKVIGMIQPQGRKETEHGPVLYQTGCAGKISNFEETQDGRFVITLTGLCRFDVANEVPTGKAYRTVEADFERWLSDLHPPSPSDSLKPELMAVLRTYFRANEIDADWSSIEQAPVSGLITSLAMICPFQASEKQALLEADTLEKQGRLLIALMQMSNLNVDQDGTVMH